MSVKIPGPMLHPVDPTLEQAIQYGHEMNMRARKTMPWKKRFYFWLQDAAPGNPIAFYTQPKGTVEPPVWKMNLRLWLFRWLYPDSYRLLLSGNTISWMEYYEGLSADAVTMAE